MLFNKFTKLSSNDRIKMNNLYSNFIERITIESLIDSIIDEIVLTFNCLNISSYSWLSIGKSMVN